MIVGLPLVQLSRDHLQVPGNMEAADDSTAQRNDVVNFVSRSRGPRHICGLLVKRQQGSLVTPPRSGARFCQFTVTSVSDNSGMVGLGPFARPVSQPIALRCAPHAEIFTSHGPVGSEPRSHSCWIICLPFLARRCGAFTAFVIASINGFSTDRELIQRFDLPAHIASLHSLNVKRCTLGSLSLPGWIKLMSAAFALCLNAVTLSWRSCACRAIALVKIGELFLYEALGAAFRHGLTAVFMIPRGITCE